MRLSLLLYRYDVAYENITLIFCLQTFKWFQVLLFNTCNSIDQESLSNTNNLCTAVWFQITNNNLLSMIKQFYFTVDGAVTSTTNPGQSRHGSNCNFKTEASISDALSCPIQDIRWWRNFTFLQRRILLPEAF